MQGKVVLAGLVAGLAGALVWALCVSTTGVVEPWDVEGTYFIGALVIAGVVAGAIAPYALWAHYVGGVVGQLLYMLMFLPTGPLIGVGVVMLGFYTLWLLAGAFVGTRIRKAFA